MEAILLYVDNWTSSKKIEMMDAPEERGYLRLLMRAAKEPDCGLPDDDAQLAIISKLGAQWHRPTKELVYRVKGPSGPLTSGEKLRECFFVRDGRLYNERLLKEHAKYLSNLEQKRSAAKKRWSKCDAEAHADAMRAHMRTHEQPDSGRICGDVCGDDAATIQTYKHTNSLTPLTPLSEGNGADAPPVLVDSEPNDKPERAAANRKPYQDVLEQVARSIHERHPNEHQRRNCSVAYVEKQLAAILKHKHVPAAECAAYLRRIDRNHTGMRASEAWQKENGQFVPALRNYLAPTQERYDIEPPPNHARKEPVRLMA